MFRAILNKIYSDAVPLLHIRDGNTKSALILGWGGAKQKHLKKITNYYLSRNINVVSVVMPLIVPLFVRKIIETHILEVLHQAINKSQNSDIICHIFSNNGSWSYARLQNHSNFPRISQLVYDSAPALFYQELSILDESAIFSRVITSVVLKRPQYVHFPLSNILQLLLLPGMTFARCLLWFQTVTGIELVTDIVKMNVWLRDHSPNVPTLFLQSRGDGLVTESIVNEYIAHLRQRGIAPRLKLFDEAVPHVAANAIRYDEYAAALDLFLSETSAPLPNQQAGGK